jgi:adenosylhomocysteine nucleosidase
MDSGTALQTEANAWTGIIVALPAEAQCLGVTHIGSGNVRELSSQVRVVLSGLGATRAERAAEGLVKLGAKALVSFGIAGALGPALRPGDLLLPDAVLHGCSRYVADGGWRNRVLQMLEPDLWGAGGSLLHSDEPLQRVEEKRGARKRSSADAVDMESGAIARTAYRYAIPFLVIRAIADPAWRSIPDSALAAIDEEGRMKPLDLLKALARHPAEIGELRSLAADYKAARESLAAVWRKAGAALFSPPVNSI